MADEDDAPQHVAEVPNLGRPVTDDRDFILLNRQLRACFVCRLVKTERQVWGRGRLNPCGDRRAGQGRARIPRARAQRAHSTVHRWAVRRRCAAGQGAPPSHQRRRYFPPLCAHHAAAFPNLVLPTHPHARDAQFTEVGCDNCRFLHMEDDGDAVANLTTPNFTGWE